MTFGGIRVCLKSQKVVAAKKKDILLGIQLAQVALWHRGLDASQTVAFLVIAAKKIEKNDK